MITPPPEVAFLASPFGRGITIVIALCAFLVHLGINEALE
jgi:hypothetical protein